MVASDDDAAGHATAGTDPDAATTANGNERTDGGGDIHSYIGARLRKEFDDVASQPVPDRFLQLMQELDRA